MKGSHLIEVENLKVFYKFTSKGLKKEHRLVQAVNDVSFFVEKNETFGIVGEPRAKPSYSLCSPRLARSASTGKTSWTSMTKRRNLH